jgi:Zn-dependent peptidase ImmA (M78 family)
MRLLELDPIQAEANRVRAAAGIEPDQVVPDIVTVLGGLGLMVAIRELARDGLDGIYASPEGGGVIVLNGAKFPHRLRCTGAHLLAHHVYGDEPHVDYDIEMSAGNFVQRRANAFASRFLVSREAIWTRRGCAGGVTVAEAQDLARDFEVTYRVILRRLREVGMTVPTQTAGGSSHLPKSAHPSHSAR